MISLSHLTRRSQISLSSQLRYFGRNSLQLLTNSNYQSLAYSYQDKNKQGNKNINSKIQISTDLTNEHLFDYFDILKTEYDSIPIDTLVLWNRRLSNIQIDELCQLFKSQKWKSLKYMNLGNTSLNAEFLKELLISFNEGDIHIHTLELDGNHDIGPDLHYIEPQLVKKSLSQLEYFCLDDDCIQNDSMDYISSLYQNNLIPNLRSLYIRENKIASESMMNFIHVIDKINNPNLTTLGLSLNPIDATCIQTMIKLFKENHLNTLKCIHVLFPSLSPQLLYELQFTFCRESYPLDLEAAKQYVYYRE